MKFILLRSVCKTGNVRYPVSQGDFRERASGPFQLLCFNLKLNLHISMLSVTQGLSRLQWGEVEII